MIIYELALRDKNNMNRKQYKHNWYLKRKEAKIGCDYCGEVKLVHLAGKHFPMNKQFQKVYLCNDCELKLKAL